MRKTIFVLFILLGSTVGAFVALNESNGLKIVLGSIGAVAGAAIGGAFAGIGCRRHQATPYSDEGNGFSVARDKRTGNYWLDRGRLTAAPDLPHPDDNDPHSQES